MGTRFMDKITVTLPLSKQTKGALLYATTDRFSTAVSNLYVRKDHLEAAGHTGEWPKSITVTVEVPEP